MKIQQQVENILKASKLARNDDKRLLIIYMQKAGMELTAKQMEIFESLPSMETITRIRRQLQERGMYEADDAVNEARYKKFVETKQNIKGSDADKVLAPLGYKLADTDYWKD